MDNTVRSCLLILTFIAGTASLYFMRDLITPFALAVFIWLIIDAFARWLDGLSPKFPYWLALTVAILTVVASIVGIILIIVDTAGSVVDQAPRYGQRLDEIFHWVGGLIGRDLSIDSFVASLELEDKMASGLAGFAGSVQGVLSNLATIAIYVAFLFAAQSSFPKKMDDLFPDKNRRSQASKVFVRIRHSIEKYIGVQTIISLMQTVISYAIMAVLGLENALFWALVIFILNYIPIVGGLAAVVLPVAFGLVQYETLTPILILAGGLFGAHGGFDEPVGFGGRLVTDIMVCSLGRCGRVSFSAADGDHYDHFSTVSNDALDCGLVIGRWSTGYGSRRKESSKCYSVDVIK